MAFSFPKKLIGKTPENVADVQSNFDAAEAEFNQDLAGDITGPRDANTLSRIARAFTRFGLLGAFNSTSTTVSYGFNVGEDGKLIDTAKAGWSMELKTDKVRFYYAAPTSGTPSFVERFSIDSSGNLSSAGGFPANSVGSSQIIDGSIVDADINGAAAIAYAKLLLTGSVTNADLAGSIAGSKLANNTLTAAQMNSAFAAGNVEPAFSTWRPMKERMGGLFLGTANDTYLLTHGIDPVPVGSPSAAAMYAFDLNLADLTVSSRATKFRLKLAVGTGGNAPNANLNARLHKVTDVRGVSGGDIPKVNTVGAAIGDPATVIAPTINTVTFGTGAEFNASATTSGLHCLCLQTSGGDGTLDGTISIWAELQVRWT